MKTFGNRAFHTFAVPEESIIGALLAMTVVLAFEAIRDDALFADAGLVFDDVEGGVAFGTIS